MHELLERELRKLRLKWCKHWISFKRRPEELKTMRMRTSTGKQISEMLSSEKRGGLPRAMLDVLRVLVVDKGVSWRSELVQDMASLRAFKGESEAVDGGEVDEAIGKLEKEGLAKVEERVRGTMGTRGGVKDELVSLTDFLTTQNALSRDRVLTSYMHERAVKAP